jgi:hypothetical protein
MWIQVEPSANDPQWPRGRFAERDFCGAEGLDEPRFALTTISLRNAGPV